MEGKGPCIREEKFGSQIRARKLQKIHAGDFIYSRLFAWRGAFGSIRADMDGAYVSNEFPNFRINKDRVYLKFLEFYFKQRWIWKEIEKKCTGTTKASRNRFKEKFFLDFEVFLPSLDEQKRIVTQIETLLLMIEEVRTLRAQNVEKAEVLKMEILKSIRAKMISRVYPIERIGRIASVTSGGTPSRENPSYWGGDIPWIKSGELNDGDLWEAEECITREGLENSSAKLFPQNTILVALYGQGQTRGRTGRLMIEATTNQACCAILPTPDKLEARFIQYWLRSLYLEMREKFRDGAQPNWNGRMIKNVKIVIPPKDVQLRIISYLASFEAKLRDMKKLLGETEKEIEELIPSLLDKAFKGLL